MKRGYGFHIAAIGMLAVGAAFGAEIRVLSTYEMLPDDNAITYPHKPRYGEFSVKFIDKPEPTDELIVGDPKYKWTGPSSNGDLYFEGGTQPKAWMDLCDGAFGKTHGDGLSDEREEELGSNPQKRDAFFLVKFHPAFSKYAKHADAEVFCRMQETKMRGNAHLDWGLVGVQLYSQE